MKHYQLIAAILCVGIVTSLGFADIYTPGTEIPPDHVASTAIFRNFTGEGPNSFVRGINSQELVFQRTTDFAAPSSFRFDGTLTPLVEVPGILSGQPFLLGYLTYTNGRFFTSTYESEIFVQTFSPDLAGATQTLLDTVVVEITPNTGDPEQSADIVHFRNRPDLGSMRVFEDEAGSIEVIAAIGSLDLVSFGTIVSNPGSAFFYPTLDEVPSDYVPVATGDGSVPPPAPVGVPEPSSFMFLGVLFGCVASRLAVGQTAIAGLFPKLLRLLVRSR